MYAQADLRLYWSHIPHCWKFHAMAYFGFSPGSVIAVIFLSVNQSGNTSTTRDLLAQSVQSGYLGELAVDSTYFYANVGGKYILLFLPGGCS